MSIFKKVLKATIKTATLPIDVVKDVATGGGVLTEKNESYTINKAQEILDALEELGDEVDDL